MRRPRRQGVPSGSSLAKAVIVSVQFALWGGCGQLAFEPLPVDAGEGDASLDAALEDTRDAFASDARIADVPTVDVPTADVPPDAPNQDAGIPTDAGGADVTPLDSGPRDPLSALNDSFEGTELGGAWNILNPARAMVEVRDGGLHIMPLTGGQWFGDGFGVMVWLPMDGDFVATARVSTTALMGPGLELAGLIVRDPNSAAGNRAHLWAGLGADNGGTIIESKSTVGSSSVFSQVDVASPYERIRVCRIGATVRTLHQPTSGAPWELHETYDRMDLPVEVHVGLMATESSSSAEFTANFDEIEFRTARSAADCEAP